MIIQIFIVILLIIMVIALFKYIYNEKEKRISDIEYRQLQLEKRIEEYKRNYKQQFKNINGFVIPIKELEKYDVNRVIKWLSEFKGKENKKWKIIKLLKL